MSKHRLRTFAAMGLIVCSTLLMAAGSDWMRKVPMRDRDRTNPYAGQGQAVAAGKLLFDDNCAKCHGGNALGRHGRPNLRSERIRHATDGELFWLLKNGSAWKGMPSWSSLPEPERWQIIAYLRSLPPDDAKSARGARH
jgi:mono/diheme cytochrome c family protein